MCKRNTIEITTYWGVCMDPISIQLREIGIILKNNRERFYDDIKECLNHLTLSNLFTDSQIQTLMNRVNKALTKELSVTLSEMSNDDYLRVLKLIERKKNGQ